MSPLSGVISPTITTENGHQSTHHQQISGRRSEIKRQNSGCAIHCRSQGNQLCGFIYNPELAISESRASCGIGYSTPMATLGCLGNCISFFIIQQPARPFKLICRMGECEIVQDPHCLRGQGGVCLVSSLQPRLPSTPGTKTNGDIAASALPHPFFAVYIRFQCIKLILRLLYRRKLCFVFSVASSQFEGRSRRPAYGAHRLCKCDCTAPLLKNE